VVESVHRRKMPMKIVRMKEVLGTIVWARDGLEITWSSVEIGVET
jgi:hypothetical protein